MRFYYERRKKERKKEDTGRILGVCGGGGDSKTVNTGRGRQTGHIAQGSQHKRFNPSPTEAVA